MVKTVLKVDGMSCGMCESHMNDLVRSLFQGKKGEFFCKRRGNGSTQ